ncbi:hypothetical protein CEQ50_16635 [Vibrio anguillarum]|nr:hypothetical protein CEQ50_16635 [Vibrio anguillarum]
MHINNSSIMYMKGRLMILYKYLPSMRIDVIENLHIRFTQLSSLNDPFEMYHCFDSRENRNLFNEAVNKADELWISLSEKEKLEENGNYLNCLNELNDWLYNTEINMSMTKSLSDYLNDKIGILSLSECFSNPLMWSHYADQYRGFVIGFNSDHEWFKKPDAFGEPTSIIKVKYLERKSVISPNSASVNQVLGEKSKHWEYEKEYRLTCNFSGFKIHPLSKSCLDEFGNKIFLAQIPLDVISCIYLGPRIDINTENKIIEIVKRNRIVCDLFKGYFDDYSIKFESISA